MRIHKGDRVVVRAGKYKGHKADVVRAMPAEGKVVIEGVNVAKRHAKPTRHTMQGGIIDKFMPIDASAVALWCRKHDGPSRAGYREEKGQKVRFCRQCGEAL